MSASIPVRWQWLLPQATPDPARLQRALELLQWLAFACMLADHIGFFVLGQQVSWLRGIGRLTFPLFGIVFAWRVAEMLRREPGRSLMGMQGRLLLAAVVSQVLFVLLLDYAELLNILFSVAAALAIVQLLDPASQSDPHDPLWRRAAAAAVVLAAVGLHADYGWSGVMMIVTMHAFFRTGSAAAAAAVVLTVLAVSLLHPQHWGVLALPLAVVLLRLGLGVGRPVRHLFYWLYPGHLFLVAGLRMAS